MYLGTADSSSSIIEFLFTFIPKLKPEGLRIMKRLVVLKGERRYLMIGWGCHKLFGVLQSIGFRETMGNLEGPLTMLAPTAVIVKSSISIQPSDASAAPASLNRCHRNHPPENN